MQRDVKEDEDASPHVDGARQSEEGEQVMHGQRRAQRQCPVPPRQRPLDGVAQGTYDKTHPLWTGKG